jgi:uncharacterized membrane protein
MTETATPTLTDHTVAVFATHDQAEAAIKSLSESGYDMKNLSIIGQNYQTEEHPVGFVNTGDRMWSWGKLGAFWGTIWGLLFGSAFMFLPGIGHVMFAGYIIGALQGAFLGGSFGVIGGALASLGVPDNSVVEYESALKAGSFLVLAHGSESEVQKAKDLLSRTPATRIDTYSTEHKTHAGCH